MEHGEHHVSRAMFEKNLLEKRKSPQFLGDIRPLLRADIEWDFDRAFDLVMEDLVSRLPGDSWRGSEQ
jgi:hypothetical protein